MHSSRANAKDLNIIHERADLITSKILEGTSQLVPLSGMSVVLQKRAA